MNPAASIPNAGEPPDLAASRAFCERLTRAFARNFYYGLRLLPAGKRAAMYALYAWMRLVDDIADHEDGRSVDRRIAELEGWRDDTHAVLARGPDAASARPYNGRPDARLVWPAFHDMADRHAVPGYVFDEVIAGQEQDLRPLAIQTFEDLSRYCYRVAGVVGLASIHVWGFTGGAESEELSIQRGLAFQLTNILRDLREDAARDRFYLPAEDVRRMCPGAEPGGPAWLRWAHAHPRQAEEFLRFQADRAQDAYRRSAPLDARVSADSRPTLVAMTDIYRGILDKIAARPLTVLDKRVSLSAWAKLSIGWRAVREARSAARAP